MILLISFIIREQRGDIMTKSEQIIELTNHYGAHNYVPLPIVISEEEFVWVKDCL